VGLMLYYIEYCKIGYFLQLLFLTKIYVFQKIVIKMPKSGLNINAINIGSFVENWFT
jgi:hypothetical protein